MEEDRALTLLQAAIASYVADLHTPVAAFLDQSADQRDPSNIPLLLHSLDDLIYFLTQEVKGKLPMQEYNNHLQGTRSYRDQLAACHQSLLHGHTPHQARRIVPSARGWSLDVNTVLLQHLDKNGFTDVEIGKHLGCSRWTVRRRRAALGSQPKRQQKHRYTEEDLIELVRYYLRQNDQVMVGYRTVLGWLQGQGVTVTRKQVRLLLQELDPGAHRLRRAVVRQRRVYKVPFPNSLWHIDGQHKLIRWKFVIHGGIDGYSRVCVFMAASDNNRAETVERSFLEAAERWGWPQRVRVDYGKENNGIWEQMVAIRRKWYTYKPCNV
ncbi:hypothetical protein FFLO_07130 [Filobasidium floriforme]|uniref:Integrase catalytic domain-containing protein n=1 Tax=Filobasidium floriforme TaxID=5210 RepID=A0A8K0NJY9_9TREE|nr:hypothetical protein FFLO_07130 [Filobasidium floriforme]